MNLLSKWLGRLSAKTAKGVFSGAIDAAMLIRRPNGLLVFGSVTEGRGAALSASLCGTKRPPVPAAWALRWPRPDVARLLGAKSQDPDLYGYTVFFPLPEADPLPSKVQLRLQLGADVDLTDAKSIRHAKGFVQFAWRLCGEELLDRLGAMPAEVLMALSAGKIARTGIRLHLDQCLELSKGAYFVAGWLVPDSDQALKVFLVDESQKLAIPLSEIWERIERPDLAETFRARKEVPVRSGFLAYANLPHSHGRSALALYFLTSTGTVMRHALAPQQRFGTRAAVRTVLGTFLPSDPFARRTVSKHAGPAIETILDAESRKQSPAIDLRWFGGPVRDPKVSLLIPLSSGIEAVRYQLAIFSTTSAISSSEIIFAVDDPAAAAVAVAAPDWLELYGVPFGVMSCGERLGYSGTLNAAAGKARGNILAFMHSNVFPDQPDWLDRAVRAFREAPGCGILGAKLLLDDDIIDSAGLEYRRWKGSEEFAEPESIGRGQLDTQAATNIVPVEGVSSACLFVLRDLFHLLGGFDTAYLCEHEFQALDFCMRARRLGARCLLDPTITMRHLVEKPVSARPTREPLATDQHFRHNLHLYNSWQMGLRVPGAQKAR